jgi:hypothetical protein
MRSSVDPGDYEIISLSTDARVGRDLVEDRSLMPKRVFAFEPSSEMRAQSQVTIFVSFHGSLLTRNTLTIPTF